MSHHLSLFILKLIFYREQSLSTSYKVVVLVLLLGLGIKPQPKIKEEGRNIDIGEIESTIVKKVILELVQSY